jgi:hypothetical protein
VQLDEARDEMVALEVEAALGRAALTDLGDAAVLRSRGPPCKTGSSRTPPWCCPTGCSTAGSPWSTVVGEHGAERVPAHLGAGRVVALEVVGVQLDEARDEISA